MQSQKWGNNLCSFPRQTMQQHSNPNLYPNHYCWRSQSWMSLWRPTRPPESEVAQSCPTLCDPMDCSPPGSSVHGIHQARILEWIAISFSRGSSQPRDRTQVSHIVGRCFNLWASRKTLRPPELTPKKDVLFIIGDCNAKVGSQEIPSMTGKFGLGVQNEAGQRLTEFCQENAPVIANTLFQQHKRWLYPWTSSGGQYWNQIDYILCSQRWKDSISLVQLLSRVRLFVTPWLQHARLPCPSSAPGTCWNSYPSIWWCHPTISFSVIPFSSCLQSFPASGSFPMSQFFASGGQSIGASASASVLPMNIQDWFPSGLTGLISLQSKGLSIQGRGYI